MLYDGKPTDAVGTSDEGYFRGRRLHHDCFLRIENERHSFLGILSFDGDQCFIYRANVWTSRKVRYNSILRQHMRPELRNRGIAVWHVIIVKLAASFSIENSKSSPLPKGNETLGKMRLKQTLIPTRREMTWRPPLRGPGRDGHRLRQKVGECLCLALVISNLPYILLWGRTKWWPTR